MVRLGPKLSKRRLSWRPAEKSLELLQGFFRTLNQVVITHRTKRSLALSAKVGEHAVLLQPLLEIDLVTRTERETKGVSKRTASQDFPSLMALMALLRVGSLPAMDQGSGIPHEVNKANVEVCMIEESPGPGAFLRVVDEAMGTWEPIGQRGMKRIHRMFSDKVPRDRTLIERCANAAGQSGSAFGSAESMKLTDVFDVRPAGQ